MALKRKKKKKGCKIFWNIPSPFKLKKAPPWQNGCSHQQSFVKGPNMEGKFQLSSWDGGSTDTLWEGSGPLPSRVGGHTPALMVYSPQHASWLLKRSFCIQDFLQMEGLKMLHCRLHNVCDNRDNYRSTAARPKMVTAFFSVPIIKLIRNLMRI